MSDARTISLSGGRTSAFMLAELIRRGERRPNDHILFANTGREREETLEFVRDIAAHWAMPVVWVEWSEAGFVEVTFETASRKGEPFEALIRKRKFLPNPVARFCTQELKIRPMKKWMVAKGYDHWTNLVGIRADEPRRSSRIRNSQRKERFDVALPLVDWGITIEHVNDFWGRQPFNLRLKQHEGNCDLCFLKQVASRVQIATERPDLAEWWHRMESETGGTFRKEGSLKQLIDLAARKKLLADAQGDLFTCFCGDDVEAA